MAVDLTHNYPENRLKYKVTETTNDAVKRRKYINKVINKYIQSDIREVIREVVLSIKEELLKNHYLRYEVDETFISAFRKLELNKDFVGKCVLTTTLFKLDVSNKTLETLVIDFDMFDYKTALPEGVKERNITEWLRSITITHNPDALSSGTSCKSSINLTSENIMILQADAKSEISSMVASLVTNGLDSTKVINGSRLKDHITLQRHKAFDSYKRVLFTEGNWVESF